MEKTITHTGEESGQTELKPMQQPSYPVEIRLSHMKFAGDDKSYPCYLIGNPQIGWKRFKPYDRY